MAGNTGAEKYIGKLMLDISDVKKQIDEVNAWLGKIGANINLEDTLSKKVSTALQKLVDEAKKAGAEAQKAVTDITKGDNLHGLESNMAKVSSVVSTTVRTTQDGIGKVVSSVTSGFDAAGNKIREFANAEGEITRRTTEVTNAVKQTVDMYVKLFELGTKVNDMEAKGDTKSTAYLKASQDIARLYQELGNVDEATKKAAQSTQEYARAEELFNAAAEMAEQRATEAAQKESAEIDRLVQKAEQADAQKAAAAERAAEREAAAAAKAAQKEIQEREKLTLMYRQMFDEIDRRNNAEMDAKNAQAAKEEQAAVEHLIALYQMYFEYKTKAVNAGASGNTASEDMYTNFANSVFKQIQALNELNPILVQTAENSDKVVVAQMAWQNAINSAAAKDAANAEKERAREIQAETIEIEKATQAFIKLEEARSRQRLAAEQNGKDSEEYARATKSVEDLNRAFMQYSDNARNAAVHSQEVGVAVDSIVDAEIRLREANSRKQEEENTLSRIKQQYFEITDAIKNYNAAKQSGDKQGMADAQARIDAVAQEVDKIAEAVDKSNLEAEAKRQVLNYIQQCRTAQTQHNAEIGNAVTKSTELESQMTGLLTRLFSIMAVIRTIRNLIKNTVEYVSEYSDKMNEIQMITLKTDSEVAELADTYRNLAEMMNVSSLDMADAAIYFTRQGLGAAEIEKRLKNVTMYAKAANVEFKDASEIITAVVNSMGLVEQEAEDGRNAAQRVADVFLKVGDSAATSGQEIGEAMQKAAASAGAFGMSFEWLASYIAAVSETTRQEARTIGTALNTIIARLHQIKQQGYNSEDETKINDVQKALAKINVTLMDENNEWRDMDTIFQEIGAQWDTLDGKTKSYIATTMAGVKQQNVFLALMNDLGKENLETTEHESRAWELYAKAIDSAGTAEEKYAVYKDSVAASQERLNIAQEKFYSLLDSDVIKSWNNALAGFINILNDGAAAMNGWNIAIPAIVAALTALVAVVIKFDAIASTLMAHPVMATISLVSVALVGLTTVISGIAAEIGSAKARFDEANQALSESRERMSELTAAQTQVDNLFADLQDGAKLTSEDLQKYNAQLEQIARVSPAAKTIVDQLKSGFIDQEEAVRKLNEEMERLIGNENKYSQVQLLKKYANWQPDETANDSMLYYLNSSWTNWTWGHEQMDNWTDAQKFAYNLKQNWMDTSSVSKMPEEVRQLIENTRKDLLQNKSLTEEQKWGIIGQLVWQEFVGTDSYSIDDALKSRAQSIVDDAINSLSAGLNPTEIKALQRNLMNMLLGEDGKMDEAEYKDIGSKMAKFMSGVIANGIQFSDIDMAEAVAESLFGTSTEGLFAEQGEAFAKKFVDQYNAAIKAGFTDSDIAKIFAESGLPTMELDRIGEILKEALQNNIADALGQEDFMSLVDWNENWENADLTTLKLVKDYMDLGIEIEEIDELLANSESMDEFVEKLQRMGEAEGAASEGSENTVKSLKELVNEIKNSKTEMSHLDNLYNKVIKNGKATIGDILDTGLADEYPELLMIYDQTDALIAKIKELRDLNIGKIADTVKNIMLTSESEAKRSPFAKEIEEAGVKTLQEYRDLLVMSGESVAEIDEYVNNSAENIKNAAAATEEAAETWLEAQAKIAETTEQVNWAKSNGFIDQVNELQGTIETNGVEAALDVWNGFTEEMRKAIANEYPNLIRALNEVDQEIKKDRASTEAATKAQKNLNAELKNSSRYANAKNFKEIYEATKKLSEGTISAKDAYTAFNKEADKVTKAYEDILDVQNKLAYNAKETNKDNQQSIDASDVSNLASMLGMTADQILADFPAAVAMFDELTSSTGDFTQALNALNEAAFIRITGTSEADFSEIKDGLISVQNMAQETVNMLLATGQWTIDTVPLNTEAWVQQKDGSWNLEKLTSVTQILKPTGANPFGRNSSVAQKRDTTQKKNRSSGGGGGGTKNNKANEHPQTEVELMLNRMAQVQAIIESQQAFYQSQSKYYNQTGQLQGVIGYSRKEIEVLTAQNEVLQQNIDKIDEYRKKKEAELATLDVSDDKYEEVRDDLERLQKAHQEYTRQVIDNKTAIDQLNETIKDTQKKIRDMQIKIREQIYKAIEDREKKAKNMLQNEISMENTILDIIKRKYEIERDKIIENTDARITALQEEKDLLSEQLRIRKEMAEEEDKAAKLAQLEANYNRIIADPTRAKEAQKIQDEINSLRKEMAWDAAEKEVKAQQDSIDQQITSLEDYKQYIEEYYEDLFAHPAKLIEEMRNIITRTDDEILDWLKENSEEYAASSENTQRQMVDTWSDTLDEMRGRIKTYWDEVEEIIAGGDDNIIQFLIDNSEDYAKAGKLQAEKYVEEWREELEDLHKALEAAFTIDAPDYVVMDPGAGGSSGGSSGGGGGGSSGGNQKNQQETQKEDHGYSFVYKNKRYSDTGYVSKRQAQNGANNHIDRLRSGATKAEADRWESLARDTLYVYKNGGIADFTGPAWLDGSKRNPERILSPYQTKLFESMVQALEKMSTISIPSMPNFGGITAGSESNVSVGDIIVNVDNLDTDDDYEELARKVSEVLMERIGRTAVVGGLRINSI